MGSRLAQRLQIVRVRPWLLSNIRPYRPGDGELFELLRALQQAWEEHLIVYRRRAEEGRAPAEMTVGSPARGVVAVAEQCELLAKRLSWWN